MYTSFDEELIKRQMKEITFKFGYDDENNITNDLDMYITDKEDLNKLLNYDIKINFRDIEGLNEIEYNKRLFIKTINNLKKNNPLPVPTFDNLLFQKDDILDFTHYIFNNYYTKEIANIFNCYFDKKEGSLIFRDNIRAFSLYLKSVDYAYIILQNNNSVFDLTEASHEYGHVISESIKKRDYYEFPFVETLPILAEMIAVDHMNEFFCELEYQDAIDYKKWYFDNILSVIAGYPKNNITSLEYYSYSLSYLLAIELYYEYLEDREKCFYKYFKLLDEYKKNYTKVLKKYDINLYAHMNNYIKTIS